MTEHVIAVVAEVDEDLVKKKEEEEAEEKLRSALVKDSAGDDTVVREKWPNKLDFLMSIIGFSVDLAGIWRL